MTFELFFKYLFPPIAALAVLFFGGRREWRFTGYWPLFRQCQDFRERVRVLREEARALSEKTAELELDAGELRSANKRLIENVSVLQRESGNRFTRIAGLEREVLELRSANESLRVACNSNGMHLALLDRKDMVTAPPSDFHWSVNLLVYNDAADEFVEWLDHGIKAANQAGRMFVVDLVDSVAPSRSLERAICDYLQRRIRENGLKVGFYFPDPFSELLEFIGAVTDAVEEAMRVTAREICPVQFYRLRRLER